MKAKKNDWREKHFVLSRRLDTIEILGAAVAQSRSGYAREVEILRRNMIAAWEVLNCGHCGQDNGRFICIECGAKAQELLGVGKWMVDE